MIVLYTGIALAIHHAAQVQHYGKTAHDHMMHVLADEIADACAKDKRFNRAEFMDKCALGEDQK